MTLPTRVAPALSVRTAVPFALAMLGVVLTGTTIAHDVRSADADLERTSIERAQGMLDIVGPSLTHEVREGHLDDVQTNVERMGALPGVAHVLITDSRDVVRMASRRPLVGTRIVTRPDAPWREVVNAVKQGRAFADRQSDDGNTLFAAASLAIPPSADSARGDSLWVIELALDLRPERAIAQRHTRRLVAIMEAVAAIVILAAWLFLRRTFTARFDDLVRRVTSYQRGGEIPPVPEDGPRELQELGVALNRLFDELSGERRALRASETRFRAVVEGGYEGIAFVDGEGNLVYRSASFADINGYSNDERLGRSALDTVHPDDVGTVQVAWQYLLGSPGGTVDFACRMLHKDGAWRNIQIKARNFLHDASLGVVVMAARDETAQKAAEDGQKRYQEMFLQAQRMEAIGTLAGGVAHDFNNILTAINVNLEFLLQEPQLPESVREGLRDLKGESLRAATLTRQLLLFSRRKTMEVTAVDLVATVSNLHRMLGRLIGEQLTLTLEPLASHLWIDGDAGMLEQVVTNLVVNARDASRPSGRIIVRVSDVSLTAGNALRHPEARAGRFARLDVIDEGEGIPPEVRARIFEPFFTTKAAGQGTGLGLATVHGIVRQHQGWIELDSTVGHGTTFSIFLPLGDTGDNRADAPGAARRAGGRGERILLAEDDNAIRRLLAPALERAGYRVTIAQNGAEALRLWHDGGKAFALLVSDIVMPGSIDGLELAERLLADQPLLRVILMTGYSRDLASSPLLTRQGVYFLSKPLDVVQLERVIEQALHG